MMILLEGWRQRRKREKREKRRQEDLRLSERVIIG